MNISEIISNNYNLVQSFKIGDTNTFEAFLLLGYPFSPKDIKKANKLTIQSWNNLQKSFKESSFDLVLYSLNNESEEVTKKLINSFKNKFKINDLFSLANSSLSLGKYDVFSFIVNISNGELIKKNNNLILFIAHIFSSNLTDKEKFLLVKNIEAFNVSYDQNNLFCIWANVSKNITCFDYFYSKVREINKRNIKSIIYKGIKRQLSNIEIKNFDSDPILNHIKSIFLRDFNIKFFYLSLFNSLVETLSYYGNPDLTKDINSKIIEFLFNNKQYVKILYKIKDPTIQKLCQSIILNDELKKDLKKDYRVDKKTKI